MKGSWHFAAQLAVTTALCVAAATARADVSSRLEAVNVTADANGKEHYAAAAAVKPGDLIEYRLVYENTGTAGVSQFTVNGPIPKGTVYVAGSATSAVKHGLKFSYDGGQSWAATPPLRAVRGADGKVREVPAPTEEITNIEWLAQEPLPAGAAQTYRYRVRVTAAQP